MCSNISSCPSGQNIITQQCMCGNTVCEKNKYCSIIGKDGQYPQTNCSHIKQCYNVGLNVDKCQCLYKICEPNNYCHIN